VSKIAQNKEKKRQAILKAALEIFISEGFVNTGMDKVSEKAEVTKQTVYRYFPSKTELFKAVLEKIGDSSEPEYNNHLQLSDPREALQQFAKHFIQSHLTPEHLATFKLLIAESSQAPEIVNSFHSVGPDKTDQMLSDFFQNRLGIKEPDMPIQIWLGSILALRTRVLMGQDMPPQDEIAEYATSCTDYLFAAINK